MRYITKMTGVEMRRIRRRAEMSRGEFADEFDLSDSSIGMMENGKTPVRKVTAMAVRYFENKYLGGPEN